MGDWANNRTASNMEAPWEQVAELWRKRFFYLWGVSGWRGQPRFEEFDGEMEAWYERNG